MRQKFGRAEEHKVWPTQAYAQSKEPVVGATVILPVSRKIRPLHKNFFRDLRCIKSVMPRDIASIQAVLLTLRLPAVMNDIRMPKPVSFIRHDAYMLIVIKYYDITGLPLADSIDVER